MGSVPRPRPAFGACEAEAGTMPKCSIGLALATVLVCLLVAALACNGQRTVNTPDAGVPDTNQPAACGFGVHVPEFDRQCVGGTGCRYVEQPPTCGCGCAACDGEKCVRTQCGMNCPDAGPADRGDVTPDSGPEDTGGPADAGERDGSLYDVHEVTDTGTGTANLGPEYRFVTEKAGVAAINGDTIAWFTEYQFSGTVGTKGSDVCYQSVSTQKTKCLGFDQNIFEILRISVFESRVAWSFGDWSKDAAYNGLAYYDVVAGRPVDVEYGKRLNIGVPAMSGDSIVYHKRVETEPGVSERRLFRCSFDSGAVTPIPTTGFPSELYLFGDDLVYFGGTTETSDDSLVWHTVLGSGTNRLLDVPNTFKYFCCGMWGRRFVYMDWLGKYGDGPDVVMYDLDSDAVTEIDAKEYGQWFPSIYENLLAWVDNSVSQSTEAGPGHVWIMDLDTGVRRQITKVAGEYGPKLYGKYMLIRADTGVKFSDYYLYDLEANGIIKDGHVVNETGR